MAPSADPLGAFYRDHHAWLRGWLRRRLGCPHGAADLAHDVFLRILASRDALYGVREPRAYLTTLASRLLIDRSRRAALERSYLDELAATLDGVAAHPSPEQILLVVEALAQIAAILADVPDKAREAFLLHYLEALPQAEIADRLGVSTRMVRKYLAHCLLRCADLAGP